MTNIIKKACIVYAAAASAVLSGCSAREEVYVPNQNRGTDYQYDFVDYLDIAVYGSEGEGVLEVMPKDIRVSDFKSEQEYITIRHAMDALNLYCLYGEDNSQSNLSVTKSEGLGSGDMVTLHIGKVPDLKGLSINLEDYDYTVNDLGEGKTIDLFNDSAVIFYGLEGTAAVGAYRLAGPGSLPDEIREHIIYTASTKETSLKEDVSIIQASASLDEEFLKANRYYNLPIYLKRHNFNASTEQETVLDVIVGPIDFESDEAKEAVRLALEEQFTGISALSGDTAYRIDLPGNVQQSTGVSGEAAYDYLVTMHGVSSDGRETAFSSTVRMVMLHDDVVIMKASEPYYTKFSALQNPYSGSYEVLAEYYQPLMQMIPEPAEPLQEEEAAAETAVPQETEKQS
ncbi:MAG: hypothetical protein K6D03_10240 [Solobacterium sp.]|nr:hypothetical protein [Solobacterium sp.]